MDNIVFAEVAALVEVMNTKGSEVTCFMFESIDRDANFNLFYFFNALDEFFVYCSIINDFLE